MSQNFKVSAVLGNGLIDEATSAAHITPLFIVENQFGKSLINWTAGEVNERVRGQLTTTPDNFTFSEIGEMKLAQMNHSFLPNMSIDCTLIIQEVAVGIKQSIEEKVADICKSIAGGNKIMVVLPSVDHGQHFYKGCNVMVGAIKQTDVLFSDDCGMYTTAPFVTLSKEEFLD